jgi:hypothetical protein
MAPPFCQIGNDVNGDEIRKQCSTVMSIISSLNSTRIHRLVILVVGYLTYVPAGTRPGSPSASDTSWFWITLASDRLHDEAVCDLEPIVVYQPAEAVQHGVLRFEGWGITEQRARLLD